MPVPVITSLQRSIANDYLVFFWKHDGKNNVTIRAKPSTHGYFLGTTTDEMMYFPIQEGILRYPEYFSGQVNASEGPIDMLELAFPWSGRRLLLKYYENFSFAGCVARDLPAANTVIGYTGHNFDSYPPALEYALRNLPLHIEDRATLDGLGELLSTGFERTSVSVFIGPKRLGPNARHRKVFQPYHQRARQLRHEAGGSDVVASLPIFAGVGGGGRVRGVGEAMLPTGRTLEWLQEILPEFNV